MDNLRLEYKYSTLPPQELASAFYSFSLNLADSDAPELVI